MSIPKTMWNYFVTPQILGSATARCVQSSVTNLKMTHQLTLKAWVSESQHDCIALVL